MSHVSRRRFLAAASIGGIGAIAALGAAGIGSVIAALSDLPARNRTTGGLSAPIRSVESSPPPPALVATLAREYRLVAAVDSARAGDPNNAVLAAISADHRAHIAAISVIVRPTAAGDASSPSPVPTIVSLQADEQAAHDVGVAASATLSGGNAVLLASIAACEAGHVEMLK